MGRVCLKNGQYMCYVPSFRTNNATQYFFGWPRTSLWILSTTLRVTITNKSELACNLEIICYPYSFSCFWISVDHEHHEIGNDWWDQRLFFCIFFFFFELLVANIQGSGNFIQNTWISVFSLKIQFGIIKSFLPHVSNCLDLRIDSFLKYVSSQICCGFHPSSWAHLHAELCTYTSTLLYSDSKSPVP